MEETQGEALTVDASRAEVCQFYLQNLVRSLLLCSKSGPVFGPYCEPAPWSTH